jgi:streptomycin 6-kinase
VLSALQPYFDKWSLAPDGEAFETASSILAPVLSGKGAAFLKVFKIEDERSSPHVLLRYNGRGAVRVIAHDAEAVLLERVMPGTPLSHLVRDGRDEQATCILCDVASMLHKAPLAPATPTLLDWAAAFTRYRRRAPHALLRESLLVEGEREFLDLCQTQGASVLLHGDLHHDNILFDGARGWLAIDPKGVAGEREFEMAMPLKNPHGSEAFYSQPDVLLGRVDVMTRQLGLDRSRVLRWNFAQAMLSTLWLNEDGDGDDAVASALEFVEIARSMAVV